MNEHALSGLILEIACLDARLALAEAHHLALAGFYTDARQQLTRMAAEAQQLALRTPAARRRSTRTKR